MSTVSNEIIPQYVLCVSHFLSKQLKVERYELMLSLVLGGGGDRSCGDNRRVDTVDKVIELQ